MIAFAILRTTPPPISSRKRCLAGALRVLDQNSKVWHSELTERSLSSPSWGRVMSLFRIRDHDGIEFAPSEVVAPVRGALKEHSLDRGSWQPGTD